MLRTLTCTLLAAVASVLVATPALAIDDEHAAKGKAMAEKAIAYLRSKQDAATGGWSVPPATSKKPHLPAVTGLVLSGLVMQPGVSETDAAVAAGAKYLLNHVQPDGGIYDRILPSYNTSIALSALAKIDTPQARAAIKPAQDFLRKLQWGEEASAVGGEPMKPVDKSDPFYGGVGYGSSGRPDLSNLSVMLQGLHDSGVVGEDKAFQRALVFLQRVQMSGEVNDMPFAKGSRQGGFVYSVGPDKDHAAAGQTNATPATVEETMDDGTKVSRLRAYGSMTYAGFKSYLYAQLPRNDTRVTEALRWIRENYTLEENPGAGPDGVYYFYVTFARALKAWGEPTVEVTPPSQGQGNAVTVKHDWANDLIDRLATLQNDDGSFKTVGERWMENDPVLVTAYGLLAVQTAVR